MSASVERKLGVEVKAWGGGGGSLRNSGEHACGVCGAPVAPALHSELVDCRLRLGRAQAEVKEAEARVAEAAEGAAAAAEDAAAPRREIKVLEEDLAESVREVLRSSSFFSVPKYYSRGGSCRHLLSLLTLCYCIQSSTQISSSFVTETKKSWVQQC